MELHPKYLVDENGKRLGVLLPEEEYQRLIETAEDRLDARDIDEAASEDGDFVPYKAFREELRAEGKL